MDGVGEEEQIWDTFTSKSMGGVLDPKHSLLRLRYAFVPLEREHLSTANDG